MRALRHPVVAVPLALLGVLAAVALAAALGRWVVHGPVRADTLARSVTDAANTWDWGTPCRRTPAERTWRCDISDDSGSGASTYRVVVEADSSCWEATMVRDGGEHPMPRRFEGCVHLWQWSLL